MKKGLGTAGPQLLRQLLLPVSVPKIRQAQERRRKRERDTVANRRRRRQRLWPRRHLGEDLRCPDEPAHNPLPGLLTWAPKKEILHLGLNTMVRRAQSQRYQKSQNSQQLVRIKGKGVQA